VAGRGLRQMELAEILSDEASSRLDELIRWGLKAEFHGGYLFAQGRAPIMGEELSRCLTHRSQNMGVQFAGRVTVAGLVVENGVGG